MASPPEDSPPSPTTPSPPHSSEENDSSPPSPPSPPPKGSDTTSPPPKESSSSTPKKSPPPPEDSDSNSSSPPTSPPQSPPPSSPPPSPPQSPPSSSKPPPSPPSSSKPPPSPSASISSNVPTIPNQNNVPIPTNVPSPPKLTPEITPPTNESSPSKHSPPPHRLRSSPGKTESGSKSDASASSLPIILGLSAGVFLLLIIIMTIIMVACCKRKKKKDKYENHIHHYHNYTASPGDDGHDNHVINLVPPPGGNTGHGGWLQTSSTPQRQTPSTQGYTSYSSDMSPGQGLPPPPTYASPSPLGLNQNSFSYEELSMATNGFSQANLLGQGGFGYVHKGVLTNGKEVAVKSLKSGSGQGEREFQAEVETISRVHHRHLVSLVGYCISGEKRMLAYDFLPNNTLEYHLHEKGPMDWSTRLKIALGAAKGLAYLHEDCYPRIIHRDIKSANILLDFTFEAKVADFGLARLTEDNNTHVSTRVMGTFGYLAPEYASSGKLTDKSDVFSFGVVLLELITGRKPLDLKMNDESLVDWARPLCASATESGNFSALVDPRLENNYVHHEMARMVACAASSIRHSARRRPKMRQVVRALEGDLPLDEINGVVVDGRSPRFSYTNETSENESSSYSYSTDMAKFRKMVMESQEYGTSCGYTSEYGLNPSSSSSSGSSGAIGPKETTLT